MRDKINNIIILGGCDFLLIIGMLILMVSFLLPEFNLLLIILYVLLGLGACCFLYGLVVCIIHVCHNNDFSGFEKFENILVLILLNILYMPIYYTKYVVSTKSIYGVVNAILYIIVVFLGLYFVFDFKVSREREKSSYKSNDNIVSININKTWACSTKNIAGNNLYCYKEYAKDSLGIFNYTDRHDTDVLVKFHVNQSIDILKKQGYKFLKSDVDDRKRFTKATLKKNGKEIYAITAVKFETKECVTIVNYYGDDIEEFMEVFRDISLLND